MVMLIWLLKLIDSKRKWCYFVAVFVQRASRWSFQYQHVTWQRKAQQ